MNWKQWTRAGALSLLLSSTAWAQEDALEGLPGFVDFGHLQGIYGEPVVQVSLAEPLLGFFEAMTAQEDPETAALFGKLKGIRVQIFDVGSDASAAIETMAEVSSRLQSEQWAPIVKVREDDERIDIFMKMAGENIEGLTVMVAGSDDQAVFVNIIGSIHPTELEKVMDSVDVDINDVDFN